MKAAPLERDERWPGILARLRQCAGNDPFDVAWQCSSEPLRSLRPAAAPLSVWRTVKRMLLVPWLALRTLGRQRDWNQAIEGKIFFVTKTANHVHAVLPIVGWLGDRSVRSDELFVEWMDRMAPRYALPFLPIFLVRCLQASRYRRSTLAECFAEYWLTYGLFLAACRALRHRPRLVVLVNDHAALPRAIALAADFLNIPTAFVPHAGVIDGLPPLRFGAAFLDGLNGARKYLSFGSSGTLIFLAGNCRLDAILRQAPAGRRRVMLCPAFGDEPAPFIELCNRLAALVPKDALVMRPHPREPARERYIEAARAAAIAFSDARAEPAAAALSGVDIIACGDSNIILEAKLVRRFVVVFTAGKLPFDRYGYIAEGLPDATCPTAAEVVAFLANLPRDAQPKSAGLDRYMATLGTRWEGRSAQLIGETMLEIANGDAPMRLAAWKPIADPAGAVLYAPAP